MPQVILDQTFPNNALTGLNQDYSLKLGIVFSILLHILLGWLFWFKQDTEILYPVSSAVFVDLIEPQKKEIAPTRQQIVSPTESKVVPEENVNTKLLSEKDSFTLKEQIKRGDSEDAGKTVAKKNYPDSPPQPKQPAIKEQQPAPIKNKPALEKPKAQTPPKPLIKELKIADSDLLEKFSKPIPPTTNSALNAASNSTSLKNLSDYRAFSRPSGSGAAFLGQRGSTDYLPSLPDGDITLLNAKADKFAVFVRRVASQVFAELRVVGWDTLLSSDIEAISDFTTVYADLSPDGKQLRVSMQSSSGSSRFDNVVIQAARRGARDANPPAGALTADGYIRFIFKARSWTQLGVSPRTGAPFERRWLLMGTGLG